MSELQFTVPAEQSGRRIDSWLAEQIEGLTRSAAQNLLSEQAVSCNGQPLKKNYKLVGGEAITIQLPELKEVDLKPENIPLDIVYEDADIVVVNKPRGMVVHPAAGNWDGTLVNALMYHCGDSLSGINGEHRPGIVHRIDKDTSGLLVVAKMTPHIRAWRLRLRRIRRIAAMKRLWLVLSRMIQERWISRLPVTRLIEKKWQSWKADGRQSRIIRLSNGITATHIWHFSSRPDVRTRFVYTWHLLVIRLSVIRCTD